MTISEKAKQKIDEAGKEIKEAIENLKQEVAELTSKVKEKFKGSGEDMRESADELTREVKTLSERVRDLIPGRKREAGVPVRVEDYPAFRPDAWERPFLELRRATDRLFDDFFRGFGWPSAWSGTPGSLTADFPRMEWPRVNMSETDDEIRVTAELPGVDRDDLDVSITDDRITISGEKTDQEESSGRGYYRLERSYGSFQRSLYLPCEVETDRVEASFKNGILTVRLPKTAAAKERIKRIPVRTG